MLGVWGGHAEATQWCPSGTTFQGPLGCVDNDDQPSKQPTTQDTLPTVTTPQRVPRSTPRSDTPPSEPAPIRTITEGQSTTFAPPVPADRQNIRGCVTSIPENSKTFFAAGGCYWRSNGDVEYRYYFDSGHSSTLVFGVCSGPYTLEVITRDSRVQTSGNQIRVTTTPSGQDTDDAGTVQVAYLLHGTRTVTHVQIGGGQITTFDTASCALTPDPVTVEVRRGTRPAMTAAVAVHAPSTEHLSTPSTVTWECTQVLVDAGVQCALNSVISTTTQPTFPTPLGCRIVVTVSENRPGHGSTNCLTSDGIAAHEDTINNGKPEDEWLDVDSLPPCPLSTAPADLEALDLDSSGRKRCVATNYPQRVPRSTPRSDTPPSKQPTTQDTPPTVTTPQRVPRSTPRSDTPPSKQPTTQDTPPTTQDTPPTVTTPQRVPRSTPRSDTPPSEQPTTQDTPPTVTTPQRVPRSTPRSDTPPSKQPTTQDTPPTTQLPRHTADDSGHTADGDDPAACAAIHSPLGYTSVEAADDSGHTADGDDPAGLPDRGHSVREPPRPRIHELSHQRRDRRP